MSSLAPDCHPNFLTNKGSGSWIMFHFCMNFSGDWKLWLVVGPRRVRPYLTSGKFKAKAPKTNSLQAISTLNNEVFHLQKGNDHCEQPQCFKATPGPPHRLLPIRVTQSVCHVTLFRSQKSGRTYPIVFQSNPSCGELTVLCLKGLFFGGPPSHDTEHLTWVWCKETKEPTVQSQKLP